MMNNPINTASTSVTGKYAKTKNGFKDLSNSIMVIDATFPSTNGMTSIMNTSGNEYCINAEPTTSMM